jgi:hypothetical protein
MILYTNARAVAVNGGHASLHRVQWFGTRYSMCSRATHRHVTGFHAAAVLLLLLVLPDSESDRAELDSDWADLCQHWTEMLQMSSLEVSTF